MSQLSRIMAYVEYQPTKTKPKAKVKSDIEHVIHIQRWWWMWRFRKWLTKRRKFRERVRNNLLLEVMIEFNYPFRQDPLLLPEHMLINVDIKTLRFA